MRRPPRAVPALATALTLVLVPGLVGCQPRGATGDAGAAAGAAPASPDQGAGRGIDIVTPVVALASLAQRVAPGARIQLLDPGGGDPHAMSLTPADRTAIADADVLLHAGDIGFQPQLEQAAATVGGAVVALAEVLPAHALRRLPGHAAHGRDAHPSPDDGHGGPGPADSDADAGATDGPIDPHVWLAPSRMAGAARAIAAAVADAGGRPARALRANATRLAGELTALERDIDRRLSGCAHRTAVVDHEAWGYLLVPRGLSQRGISGAGGHGPASPRHLGRLADLIEARGLPAVFASATDGNGHAAALAAEAGAALLEVDPLTTTSAEAGAWRQRGYRQMLLEQVATFAEGLGCRR